MNAFDEKVLSWITSLVDKSAILDRIMIILANDYFIPVCIALILLGLWFYSAKTAQPEKYQRSVIFAAVSIGSASGFVMAANYIWRHPHPFEEDAAMMEIVKHIFYPIHDPTFPSNTSAVTFAAATSVWQANRKIGLLVFIPAVLMPFAKLYAAAYWPSDVLAGAALGIATSYFIHKLAMPPFNPIIRLIFWILRKLCLA